MATSAWAGLGYSQEPGTPSRPATWWQESKFSDHLSCFHRRVIRELDWKESSLNFNQNLRDARVLSDSLACCITMLSPFCFFLMISIRLRLLIIEFPAVKFLISQNLSCFLNVAFLIFCFMTVYLVIASLKLLKVIKVFLLLPLFPLKLLSFIYLSSEKANLWLLLMLVKTGH